MCPARGTPRFRAGSAHDGLRFEVKSGPRLLAGLGLIGTSGPDSRPNPAQEQPRPGMRRWTYRMVIYTVAVCGLLIAPVAETLICAA